MRVQPEETVLTDLQQQLARETSVPRVEEFFSTLANNFESRIQKQAWKVSEYQADGDPPAAR